jgi:hypothetical protein
MFNQSWVRTCVRMQDWAPYTNTEEQGINTFSKGIWKSVYTVEVSTAAITAVVPQIFYSGEYPTSPLQDGSHGGFEVQVRAHMWAATATSGTVSISGDWGGSASQPVQVPAGESDVSHPRTHGTPPPPPSVGWRVSLSALPIPCSPKMPEIMNAKRSCCLPMQVTLKMTASASQIKLWWPAGHGAQPLYNLSVSFKPSTALETAAAPEAIRRVGFRMFALVTGNDTDPAYVKANEGTDGTDGLGMLWRVNGAVIWCKGANMIPMEELGACSFCILPFARAWCRMCVRAHRATIAIGCRGTNERRRAHPTCAQRCCWWAQHPPRLGRWYVPAGCLVSESTGTHTNPTRACGVLHILRGSWWFLVDADCRTHGLGTMRAMRWAS